MTVYTAQSLRPAKRKKAIRACVLAVAISAAAFGAVPGMAAPVDAVDPAKQVVGKLAVTKIDFKRGDNGAGRLILGFAGDGASPEPGAEETFGVHDVGEIFEAELVTGHGLEECLALLTFEDVGFDAEPGVVGLQGLNGGVEGFFGVLGDGNEDTCSHELGTDRKSVV